MPELKRDFRRGKMNKDLDERLVPNGEFRDALNIQVAGSEASEVGSAQNILGNRLAYPVSLLINGGQCVPIQSYEEWNKCVMPCENIIIRSKTKPYKPNEWVRPRPYAYP